jgi:hypothetical protein
MLLGPPSPRKAATGSEPHWRADGKEIFFEENGTMFAVDVKTSGSALEPGVPQQLFRASIAFQ